MRKPLKINEEIVLKDIDVNSNRKFKIIECIGWGATCLVYRASCEDKTEHILREFYPKNLDLIRTENGEIIPRNNDAEEFYSLLEAFDASCDAQKTFRQSNKLKNYIFDIKGLYSGNGTKYVSMSELAGADYSRIEEKSLYDLVVRIKTLAKVVGYYHEDGYLHLDIKPENIFVRPEDETKEDIKLFDFGSILPISETKLGKGLSYTKSWSAPEQILPNQYKYICPATDIFAIGEIIFYKIFGRHSKGSERWSIANFEFDKKNAIFENVSDKVFASLEELFRHTICNFSKNRYQNIEELVKKLDEIIPLANPTKPRIVTKEVEASNYFVGRNKELNQIHYILENENILFIRGIGGIGKSELVKQYIKAYKSEYTSVVFAAFVNDLKSLLADDETIKISNMSIYHGETAESYAERKFEKLQELSDDNTLFVLDNFDVDISVLGKKDDKTPKYIDLFFELKGKKIITTRSDFSGYNYGKQMVIRELNNCEDIKNIFKRYYKSPIEDKCLEEIIELVDGHTMAVELIAKQLACDFVAPENIIATLKKGVLTFGGGEVENGKDGITPPVHIYTHVSNLFELSIFAKEEKEEELFVLQNLSIIPHTGVDAYLFIKWCRLANPSVITKLEKSGWLRNENSVISLHPVISEVIHEKIKRDNPSLLILDGLLEYVKSEEYFKLETEKRISLANLLLNVSEILYRLDIKTLETAEFLKCSTDFYWPFGYSEEAQRNNEKSLEIFKSINAPIDKISSSMCALGRVYQNIGYYDSAENTYKQALDVLKKNNMKTSNSYATACLRMGLLFNRTNTDGITSIFEQQENYFKTAISIREKIFGENSTLVASCYGSLGDLYCREKRFEESEELQLKACKIQESQNSNSYNVALSYSKLGQLYLSWNKIDKAEEYFNKALDIRKELFGDKHYETAISYSNLGILYSKKGDLYISEEYYKKALKIQEDIFGREHPTTKFTYDLLKKLKALESNN